MDMSYLNLQYLVLNQIYTLSNCWCRVAEAKLLLHKLIQEKAKLQLMRVKRDISLVHIYLCFRYLLTANYIISNSLSFTEKSSNNEVWSPGVSNVEVQSFYTSPTKNFKYPSWYPFPTFRWQTGTWILELKHCCFDNGNHTSFIFKFKV